MDASHVEKKHETNTRKNSGSGIILEDLKKKNGVTL